MLLEEVNQALRFILDEITGKYGKSKVVQVLFGQQRMGQYFNFVKGRDFGLKPLSRMAKVFGYDIHIVFVKDDDIETLDYINQKNEEFFKHIEETIANIPDEALRVKRGRKSKVEQFNDDIEDLVNELRQEIKSDE